MISNAMQTAMADTLPLWKDLNSAQKERFLENASHQSYKKDQLLLSSDAQCLGMILVTSGSLRVYLLSEEGREITLYRINAGEFCVLSASCVLNSITFDVYVDAVMAEAEHLCMTMRGVKKPGTTTVSVVARGAFKEDEQLRNLFFQMLGR